MRRMMQQGDKAAIVCCSDGQKAAYRDKINELSKTLREIGLVPVFSDFIYAKEDVFAGTALERADSLMAFYRDEEIRAIFDISGGDIANEILPYLDFEVIAGSDKQFWGYSDLTTIINAIYAKTGQKSVLYQVRNLVYENSDRQIADFTNTVMKGQKDLWDFEYRFLQGKELSGIVVGGNIRCLLKLAGTEYWPDMTGKVLLLESLGGAASQMVTYLSQLKQIGVFDKVNGILLGTFTKMEQEQNSPSIEELVMRYAGTRLSVVKTQEIGHGTDSKGIVIGEYYDLFSPFFFS